MHCHAGKKSDEGDLENSRILIGRECNGTSIVVLHACLRAPSTPHEGHLLKPGTLLFW